MKSLLCLPRRTVLVRARSSVFPDHNEVIAIIRAMDCVRRKRRKTFLPGDRCVGSRAEEKILLEFSDTVKTVSRCSSEKRSYSVAFVKHISGRCRVYLHDVAVWVWGVYELRGAARAHE